MFIFNEVRLFYIDNACIICKKLNLFCSRGMLSAAHILAMDAKNLLDVIDSIRIRYPDVNTHICTGMPVQTVENEVVEAEQEVRPACHETPSLGSLERQKRMAVPSSAMSNVMVQQPIYSSATKPPLLSAASGAPVLQKLSSATGSLASSNTTSS
jgi:hypothetical protein